MKNGRLSSFGIGRAVPTTGNSIRLSIMLALKLITSMKNVIN